MKLNDIVQHSKDSITPKDYPERRYNHYSLPAYDNYMTPTIDSGDSIASNKYQVFKNSILISKLNPGTSRVWKIEDCNTNSICSTEFVQLNRINTQMCSLRYLYYYLSSPLITGKLKSMASGTSGSHQRVKPKDILDLEINLPILEEQKAIAEALSSLDDKIELLQKQNETLEALAQTLFRQWFIEEADNSWEEAYLKDIVQINYGKDHKLIEAGDIPIYGSGGIMRYGDSSICNTQSVLIPRKGTLNNVMLVKGGFWTVDTMFWTKGKFKGAVQIVYYYLSSLDLNNLNVGSAVPSLTTKTLNALKFRLPNKDRIDEFISFTDDINDKQRLNKEQIQTLEHTRDTLLPKLMSGQVRVKLD